MRETDASGQVKAILTGTSCAYQRQEGQAQHPVFSTPRLRDIEPAISIQAITDCTVAIIDYRDMDELLSRPTLASAIWRASMLEAAAYRARLSSTSRGTALEQVAHLLCEQLARREAVGALGPQLPFSQVVADATGLSVVHVNRTIQTLRGLNVLSKATRAIEVVDREQLTKIAGFDGRYLTMSTLASRWTVQIEEPATRTYSSQPESGGRNMPAATHIARARISTRMEPRHTADGTSDDRTSAVPSEWKSL